MNPTSILSSLAIRSAFIFWLALALFPHTAVIGQQAAPRSTPSAANSLPADLAWHDVSKWGVEGRGWGDQERKRWFDRLPAKAEGTVTPAVWGLSRDSAGMIVRFKTDARSIYARYTLMKTNLSMSH